MRSRVLLAFVIAAVSAEFGIFSCTVDVAGAPCTSNDNCPTGQSCGGGGTCELGSSGGRDMGRGGDDGRGGDGAVSSSDSGPKDAGTDAQDSGQAEDAAGDAGDSGPADDVGPSDVGPGGDVGHADAGDGGDAGTTKCSKTADCDQDAGRQVCVQGLCLPGNCTSESECTEPGRPTCGADHYCTDECGADAGPSCGTGFMCCNGVCRGGDCCADGDCGSGKCVAFTCQPQCASDGDCQSGRCCKGFCAPEGKGCCKDDDCGSSLYGYLCAGNVCTCSSDADCPADAICDLTKSPRECAKGCSVIHPCGSGNECCFKKCYPGDCCADKECTIPGKPRCESHKCTDTCTKGVTDCGAGFLCCNDQLGAGHCAETKCCSDADCAAFPDRPHCDPNAKDCVNFCDPPNGLPCGQDHVCCSGVCYKGNCCETAECPQPDGGVVKCINRNCSSDCTVTADLCLPDKTCCQEGPNEGRCYQGECCTDDKCANDADGHKCLPNFMCGCSSNADCEAGRVCIASQSKCVPGNCLTSADCTDPSKPICSANFCKACTGDQQCGDTGKGTVCCSGRCLFAECCADVSTTETDCEPFMTEPICSGGQCTPCTSDTQCSSRGLGGKCCRQGAFTGDCFNGTCCSSFECTASNPLTTTPICGTLDRSCHECDSDQKCQEELGDRTLTCCRVENVKTKGVCFHGQCCDNNQCANLNTPLCDLATFRCVQCLGDNDCGAGARCCNGTCYQGNCCGDGECAAAETGTTGVCYQHHCRIHCDAQTGCGPGGVETKCCDNIASPLWPFPLCVPVLGKCCLADSECGTFSYCCAGICYPVGTPCF